MASLLSGLVGRLLAIGAGLAALTAAVLTVRKSGADGQRAADIQKGAADNADANEARASVAPLPDGRAADELRAGWSRDK